ncbi:cell division protein FtsL [Coxiella endosymbiont of Ornithodoros amblus]|uniref:cell division protein FtsL n=1 Tax=Coxiella endosymbiont of Ornithodoros amblus TaxID=1656166 RepID=UPI00244E4133|nr:cell division protein FtsL [Coxiella endosymbiont of Ornithodoros amblus]MBW5802370.1 cell division protein FtsL [Coxiella endosymbiont of Ornithodoros amblus]
MNTTARVIVVQNVRTRNRSFQVTKEGVVIVALVIALLCSAFGVVYFKDLNRRLFIQYQTLQREKAEELIQWEKLLLEQTTWSTQSRVQRIAKQQLGMQLPSAKEVILVNADAIIE